MHKSITVRFNVIEETLIILIHKIKEQFQVQKRGGIRDVLANNC